MVSQLLNMERIGEYSGYQVYLVSEKDYYIECQYVEDTIFAVKEFGTNRAHMHLNGVCVGLLDCSKMRVIHYDDSKAPKEWKKPKAKSKAAPVKQTQSVEVSATIEQSQALDKRYKEVIAEFYKVCCK